MRELAEEGRCADDDIDTVDTYGEEHSALEIDLQKEVLEGTHTSLDGDAGIVHVAANVGEDLGTETELADGLAIETRLLGGSGGGELDVLDTECVKSLGNSNLGLGVEESIGELFSL